MLITILNGAGRKSKMGEPGERPQSLQAFFSPRTTKEALKLIPDVTVLNIRIWATYRF